MFTRVFLVAACVLGAALASTSSALADTAPTVTTQPDVAFVSNPGASTSLTAAADGSPAPSVQWEESTKRTGPWTPITGATDTTLSVTATSSISATPSEPCSQIRPALLRRGRRGSCRRPSG